MELLQFSISDFVCDLKEIQMDFISKGITNKSFLLVDSYLDITV